MQMSVEVPPVTVLAGRASFLFATCPALLSCRNSVKSLFKSLSSSRWTSVHGFFVRVSNDFSFADKERLICDFDLDCCNRSTGVNSSGAKIVVFFRLEIALSQSLKQVGFSLTFVI